MSVCITDMYIHLSQLYNIDNKLTLMVWWMMDVQCDYTDIRVHIDANTYPIGIQTMNKYI